MKGDLSEYSVIQTKEALETEGQVSRIVEFIEKPDQPQTLDSDLMAVGRYVLNADIWAELEKPSQVPGTVFSSLTRLPSWRRSSLLTRC
jgi:UTP-glucose-1-phosphate uridylyltransferase